MRSAEPTSFIEVKGANHQSILKSFNSRPAAVRVTVKEAPEYNNVMDLFDSEQSKNSMTVNTSLNQGINIHGKD